jgi:hypothetical protein
MATLKLRLIRSTDAQLLESLARSDFQRDVSASVFLRFGGANPLEASLPLASERPRPLATVLDVASSGANTITVSLLRSVHITVTGQDSSFDERNVGYPDRMDAGQFAILAAACHRDLPSLTRAAYPG